MLLRPMSRLGQTLLKTLALTVALLFLVGAVTTASWQYLFGTKIGPLFGMSADALAGTATEAPGPDAGPAEPDAGAPEDTGEPERPSPRYFHGTKSGLLHEERTFMPASKSLGGLGLPHAGQAAPGRADQDAGR